MTTHISDDRLRAALDDIVAVMAVAAGQRPSASTPPSFVSEAADSAGDQAQSDPLVHVHVVGSRPRQIASLQTEIPTDVRTQLNVDAFWSHQAQAIDHVLAGDSVVIASGTASGKSLVSQCAIGVAGADDRPATALLLFPTKALGHDQLRALNALDLDGVVAAAYDGDSTDAERTWVRRHANVICTNPDMLHHGILPRHGHWATFLRRLRYVVVDETHVFRGIFGAHVAHVLRRLQRLCAELGSEPTFIFASATVAQPEILTSALCGKNVIPITEDGSPRGERVLVVANPPLLDPTTGKRASSHRITAQIAATLISRGLRTIVFCRSRHATETVSAAIRAQLRPELIDKVQPYRAGYLGSERREIERDLTSGALLGVVATSALELGIDVGGLDACVVNGFPGTISSFRQQIGRIGRGTDASLAVFVAGTDQLDQYFATHPRELIDRNVEAVVVNPSNSFVLDSQIGCAAAELPLSSADEKWWGDDLDDAIRRLVGADQLRVQRQRDGNGHETRRAVWAGHGHPAGLVGLRSGSNREVRISTANGVLIGTVDASRARETLYPGASYLHRTEPYRVVELDLDRSHALIEPDDGSTTTRVRSVRELSLLGVDQQRDRGPLGVFLGAVSVRSTVTGYQRIDVRSGEVIENVELEMGDATLQTRAFWYTFSAEAIATADLHALTLPGALHAAEHSAIAMLPLFAICDRWDVGGVSTPWQSDAGAATVAIYDGYPGGVGIAELGFAAADRHLATTLEMVRRCTCTAGCPSCIQSPKCGNGNEPLDKQAAIALLTVVQAS